MRSLFNSFKDLSILIIGDVMMDAYLFGKVDRVSPEAPVPIVSVGKKEARLGGAANVALNIKALGAKPIICAIVGDDIEGRQLLDLFSAADIDATSLVKIVGRKTTVKTRVIAQNQQILRVDAETDTEINIEESNLVLNKFRLILERQKIDAIIFQDYDKGLITPYLIDEVSKSAKANNIPLIVDPKKRNFLSYKDVDVFKPNLKELKEGLKVDFDPKNYLELKNNTTLLKEKIKAKNILLTLSELGIYAINDKEDKLTPAHIRTIADVSGAGDTVISVVATCIAARTDIFLAARLGNLAGGLVCEKVGVVPINKDLLLQEALKAEEA
ncbi:D-glycero-beta-D-manno-heptose-7-phosphate kinase [Pedobacter sp. SD-b]|uniref:D-glycero-beta-D-manno-heptose-7-phosphate kinase n=1 Tax=Pedobacter segetis TaxID=2793069 RepID=A0ABS1BI44_9SPHI|nr:bifunctional ADP-heptose synthase [Pedobacter segetis]MBK0382552.1 D-glycero-beta-D-manno-heptose-7-phosphate kinase [Pedobacter segetis]